MHTLRAQKAYVQSWVVGGLKLQGKAGLDSVRRLVVFVKAGDDRVAKEAAAGDCSARTEAERSSVRISSTEHIRKCDGGDVWCAGKSKQACGGIERVFLRTSGLWPAGSAAGRLLARQQWHGDDAVEDSAAAT